MKSSVAIVRALSLSFLFSIVSFGANPALAAGGKELEQDARTALERLYAHSPAARDLAKRAKGVLVFPSVVKAGLMIGGQ